ncbi:unnamed protein product [Paramecium sonneborni]|uniref:Uncharacterized protein n=1 Tax=Paramecium sonneborni TaxID=65129 RepID=A0A8S1KF85_9CILI|nr:unnamed protein product [Paramecium sonneborni]
MFFQILLCASLIEMIKGQCSSGCECCMKVDEDYKCEDIKYCLRILWIWFAVWLIITIGYIIIYSKKRKGTKVRMDRIVEFSSTALRQWLILSNENNTKSRTSSISTS